MNHPVRSVGNNLSTEFAAPGGLNPLQDRRVRESRFSAGVQHSQRGPKRIQGEAPDRGSKYHHGYFRPLAIAKDAFVFRIP